MKHEPTAPILFFVPWYMWNETPFKENATLFIHRMEKFLFLAVAHRPNKNWLEHPRIVGIHWKMHNSFIRIIRIVVNTAPPLRLLQTNMIMFSVPMKRSRFISSRMKYEGRERERGGEIIQCLSNAKNAVEMKNLHDSNTMNGNWWKLSWIKENFLLLIIIQWDYFLITIFGAWIRPFQIGFIKRKPQNAILW